MNRHKQINSVLLLIATALCLITAGCATPPKPIASEPLKPGEIVHVHFSKAVGDADDSSPDFVRTVGTDGIISIQSVTVAVAGLTPAEASAKIRDVFANHSLHFEVDLRRIKPNPSFYADNEAQTKFGIFLTVNPNIDTRPGLVDLAHVQLESSPVISADDIISYDFSMQTMKLRHGVRFENLQIPVRGLPFVVVANGQRIYLGAFWTPISSIPSPAPIIEPHFQAPADVLFVEPSYPTASAGQGPDPRSDPRIKNALAALHKLD